MQLDIISYHDLFDPKANSQSLKVAETALLQKGIVGVSHVPDFASKSQAYINAIREFANLPDAIKHKYAPNRDAGETEGFELGAEWFKNEQGEWIIDDKKSSYYAYVPNDARNKWPQEMDLQTPYLALGQLIFNTGKILMKAIGLDESLGLKHDAMVGYGRMLHYYKEGDKTNANENWCGMHLDHGIFTGLLPAYYFRDGEEVDEPEEAGLYIVSNDTGKLEKINANDKSILLFQVGEFGQLASHDRIQATRHVVKKSKEGIERFTFALFYMFPPEENILIHSHSHLTKDARYTSNQSPDGGITYRDWEKASYERYRAM